MTDVIERSDWKKRRIVLYAALSFIAVWLSWILYKGTDSVLYQNALYVLGGGAVVLIGQYVFGAAYDDRNFMQSIVALKTGQGAPIPDKSS